jgi:hypothetical protein
VSTPYRPEGPGLGDAPETDPQSGDFYFRFPLPDVPVDAQEDLFRAVVEEQLRALLDLVELSDGDRALRVTGYRLLCDPGFRSLETNADDSLP